MFVRSTGTLLRKRLQHDPPEGSTLFTYRFWHKYPMQLDELQLYA